MGLDNGFILKSKSNPNLAIEIAYFRKYYELNEYIRGFSCADTNDEVHYYVDLEILWYLHDKIVSLYDILITIPEDTLIKYDEEGYPEEYHKKMQGYLFSPCGSRSVYAGLELIRLFHRVETMIEILNHDISEDLYFEFYSSY